MRLFCCSLPPVSPSKNYQIVSVSLRKRSSVSSSDSSEGNLLPTIAKPSQTQIKWNNHSKYSTWFVVIGILSLAKVITNLYPLTILSFIFMACAYVLCIIDYSCGIIGKRRLLMQIIIYLLILKIIIGVLFYKNGIVCC